MGYPKRKTIRLKGYDYSRSGYYFVTVCTYQHRSIFSKICVGQGLAPAENRLTVFGKIAEEQLLNLEKRYSCVRIDKYIIMPNHIHAIIEIKETAGASPCPTLSDIVCAYKSITSRIIKKYLNSEKIFQNSFYDHVIRGEKDYYEIWNYIDGNHLKWSTDCFYKK